jgi:MoxR-like ATPase
MTYKPHYPAVHKRLKGQDHNTPADRDLGEHYVYTPEIDVAVQVAIATGRPLLLRGKPGTGKSTLAKNVAKRLKLKLYSYTVTSRTQARDLLFTYDTLARLNDAQLERPDGVSAAEWLAEEKYRKAGPLWLAFDDPEGAVVLIDEIDKADPDVPNDLLIPLGSLSFDVSPGVTKTATVPPLVFITTNEERELPLAFIRRCIALNLKPPGAAELATIVRTHFPNLPDRVPLKALAEAFVKERDTVTDRHLSTAEFLDAVDAYKDLQIKAGDSASEEKWRMVMQMVVVKPNPEEGA